VLVNSLQRGDRDTCLRSSLNETAVETGKWQVSLELAEAITDDAKEVSGQELDIDAEAVLRGLAKLRGLEIPTIPFLQVNISGVEETVYGMTLNARKPQTRADDAIKVAGMLLGGINNSAEEQGLYLAGKFGPDADENQKRSDEMLTALAEEVAASHPADEAELGLLTPADYALANASSRRLRNGLSLDRFAVYSYIKPRGNMGPPERPYTLFPQTTLSDGTALLGLSADDRESSAANFMRGSLGEVPFSVGARFSIAPSDTVGQGNIHADRLANLISHRGAGISSISGI
jgi:hypothetical protein